MRKKIYILLVMLLFTTGCACRYDLTIDNDTYKESIILAASSDDEKDNLNRKWEIPVDKNNYYLGDENIDETYTNYIYDYKVNSNNNLVFSHNFGRSDYLNSTAVSICYKTLSVSNYQETTVISTSNNAMCFDSYRNLSSLMVNITVSNKVISNNADKVNGNTYTWNINRNNASDKSINMVFENKETTDSQDNQTDNIVSKNEKYTMYIFAGILLIIVLIIYFIFNNLKNKDDGMDD